MSLPRLIVLTDWAIPGLEDRLAAVASLGARVGIQHRDAGAPTRLFLERARRLAALCANSGAALFVNGRLDVALTVGAHVHLPEDGPTAAEVRPLLPSARWISAAFHAQTPRAQLNAADFALVSPVFAPGSKPSDSRPQLGAEGFAQLAAALPCPAFALGGMDAERLRSMKPFGVAAISAVLSAADPKAAAASILHQLR